MSSQAFLHGVNLCRKGILLSVGHGMKRLKHLWMPTETHLNLQAFPRRAGKKPVISVAYCCSTQVYRDGIEQVRPCQ